MGLSDDVLASVGQPIRVDTTVVEGGTTLLSTFAVAIAVSVSLMFVTILRAGTLALEREENAFRRLVRGLVTRTALLVEKAGLAAVCAFVVTLVMLAGLALFVDLDWSRIPLWPAAPAGGAVAFGATGWPWVRSPGGPRGIVARVHAVAPGGVPRPGAIGRGVERPVRCDPGDLRAVPFKPTLDAVDAALNDAGDRGAAPPSGGAHPGVRGARSGCAAPVRLGRCIGIARQVGSGRAEAPAPAQHSLRGPASAAGDAPRPRPHRRLLVHRFAAARAEDPERTVEAVLHHNLAGYAAAAIESGSLELPAEQARRLARSGVLRVPAHGGFGSRWQRWSR